MAPDKKEKNISRWQIIRSRLFEPTSTIFLIVIAFYLIQAIISPFSGISPPLTDFITVMVLISIAFFLHLLFGFKRTVPIFLAIGFFIHIIGLYKIIPYNANYIGELYGAPQLAYHYDWFVHSFGTGCLAVALSSMLYPYLKKAFSSKYLMFAILLLCVLGLGSLNEITEYIGFTIFGYGEGFMEFGAGDSSPFEGPWQNSCMDMTNNLMGGILFIGVFMLDKRYGLFGKKEVNHILS
ncbi:MAG: hypothetical protein NT001_07405 [Candidatus Woesearchaeota archaeon]|nr:hypothetical protein [Candidatus Woesearchaeota archaeon]